MEKEGRRESKEKNKQTNNKTTRKRMKISKNFYNKLCILSNYHRSWSSKIKSFSESKPEKHKNRKILITIKK